jgi:ribosomal protein S18 acetylase RimI-like enzyme
MRSHRSAPLTIRLATPADAAVIATMSRDLIETGLGWGWQADRVVRAIRARDTCVIVTAAGSRAVAFAIMQFGDTRAHLSLLAVSPGLHRRGIGRRMMTWLEESALTAGIATVTLELRQANLTARDFYRALGYSDVACIPGYYRGVETALRMERDIRRATAGDIG